MKLKLKKKIKLKNKSSIEAELKNDNNIDAIQSKEEATAKKIHKKYTNSKPAAGEIRKFVNKELPPSGVTQEIKDYLNRNLPELIDRYTGGLGKKVEEKISEIISKKFRKNAKIKNKIISAKDFKSDMLNNELKGWELKFFSKDLCNNGKNPYLFFQRVVLDD